MENLFITSKAASQLLNISIKTLYQWVNKRSIVYFKPPGSKFLLFKQSDIISLIESGKIETTDNISNNYLNSLSHAPNNENY